MLCLRVTYAVERWLAGWVIGFLSVTFVNYAKTAKDTDRVAMECEWETVHKLSSWYFSMTLSDLRSFQGHAIIWRWISQKRYQIQTSFNGLLIGTYTRPTQGCHFRMTLNDSGWLSEIFNDMKHRATSLRQLRVLFMILSTCNQGRKGKGPDTKCNQGRN